MNNFELASLLSKVNLSDADCEQAVKQLENLGTLELQQDFFSYCKRWKLAPWIWTQLNTYSLSAYLEPDVSIDFEKEHQKVKDQNEARNKTALIFLKEFQKEGIDVVILKGNYLAHTAYKDSGYKRMNDFDILIHKEDWDRIQDIYLRLGYIPLGFGWSGEKEKPASFSHVGMSFISRDYSCIIGSQWGLKSPTTNYSVNIDEVWKTAKEFIFFDTKVKCLSAEYNLLHLILHLGIYKCGIRDCMDLYNLVRTTAIDEAKMLGILKESNAIEKAVFALNISNLCVPEFHQDFVNKLPARKNGFLARRLRKRKRVASISGDFQDSYNDYFQDIEKQVIYFNLFQKFHVKLIFYFKILRMIYFPKTKFALKLNDKWNEPTFGNKVVSALKAPYFVFSLIAQEIGWKFTVLLFVKLGVDLLISIKNYVFRSQSYFDYLHEKGIDPEDIQKAVKNIQ